MEASAHMWRGRLWRTPKLNETHFQSRQTCLVACHQHRESQCAPISSAKTRAWSDAIAGRDIGRPAAMGMRLPCEPGRSLPCTQRERPYWLFAIRSSSKTIHSAAPPMHLPTTRGELGQLTKIPHSVLLAVYPTYPRLFEMPWRLRSRSRWRRPTADLRRPISPTNFTHTLMMCGHSVFTSTS